MSRAVPRSTGQPVGMKGGGKRPPQSIDFDYFNGLSDRAEREIRAAEDALIKYVEDEEKRAALYADQDRNDTASFENKYPAMRKEGIR